MKTNEDKEQELDTEDDRTESLPAAETIALRSVKITTTPRTRARLADQQRSDKTENKKQPHSLGSYGTINNENEEIPSPDVWYDAEDSFDVGVDFASGELDRMNAAFESGYGKARPHLYKLYYLLGLTLSYFIFNGYGKNTQTSLEELFPELTKWLGELGLSVTADTAKWLCISVMGFFSAECLADVLQTYVDRIGHYPPELKAQDWATWKKHAILIALAAASAIPASANQYESGNRAWYNWLAIGLIALPTNTWPMIGMALPGVLRLLFCGPHRRRDYVAMDSPEQRLVREFEKNSFRMQLWDVARHNEREAQRRLQALFRAANAWLPTLKGDPLIEFTQALHDALGAVKSPKYHVLRLCAAVDVLRTQEYVPPEIKKLASKVRSCMRVSLISSVAVSFLGPYGIVVYSAMSSLFGLWLGPIGGPIAGLLCALDSSFVNILQLIARAAIAFEKMDWSLSRLPENIATLLVSGAVGMITGLISARDLARLLLPLAQDQRAFIEWGSVFWGGWVSMGMATILAPSAQGLFIEAVNKFDDYVAFRGAPSCEAPGASGGLVSYSDSVWRDKRFEGSVRRNVTGFFSQCDNAVGRWDPEVAFEALNKPQGQELGIPSVKSNKFYAFFRAVCPQKVGGSESSSFVLPQEELLPPKRSRSCRCVVL